MKANPVPGKHLNLIPEYHAGRTAKDVEGNFKTVKLSSNEVLWGASPKAVKALRKYAGAAHYYPLRQPADLLSELAAVNNVKTSNIVLGNGSNEIIQFAVQAYVSPSENVIIPSVTFSMYEIYSRIARAKVTAVRNNSDYSIDLKGIKNKINSKTRIIFLTSPNNPTGLIIGKNELEDFISEVPGNIIVFLDEAYADFCKNELKTDFPEKIAAGQFGNLIIARTFSKVFGLAGLRLGYGISAPGIISNMVKVSQPFNVNSFAVTAGLYSLKDKNHYNKIVSLSQKGRDYLEKGFRKFKIPYIPSQANFIMIEVGNGKKACAFFEKHGLIVRDLSSFGLPSHIRVTVSNMTHNKKILDVLRKFLN